MIYTVTFNPALDYILFTSDLKFGAINRAKSERLHLGGKGINVATILQEHSVPVTAVGFVAGHTGELFEKMAAERGLQTRFISVKGETRINVKIRDAEETDINGSGAEVGLQDLNRLARTLSDMESDSVLVVSGSLPRSLPKNAYSVFLNLLQDKNIRIIADVGGDLLADVLPCHPWLVKPNADELGQLFGVSIQTFGQARIYAENMRSLGARNVLVSMGAQGALLVNEQGQYFTASAFEGEVQDTVGAGDSLLAAFLAKKEQGADDQSALNYACAAGSATAFRTGLATRAEIEALIQNR